MFHVARQMPPFLECTHLGGVFELRFSWIIKGEFLGCFTFPTFFFFFFSIRVSGPDTSVPGLCFSCLLLDDDDSSPRTQMASFCSTDILNPMKKPLGG